MIEYDQLTPRQRNAIHVDNEGSFEQRKALAATTIPEDGEHFHVLLQCNVQRLSYDWQTRHGQVWCSGPTDMRGAIALFEAIDADVRLIQTYQDGALDTAYRRGHRGWASY